MSLLDARDLSRRYGVRTILDGVSLTLSAGERVGVVGANGSGKSTLGRILAGVEEADAGEVVRRKGARVGFLPQEPIYEGDPTAIEAALAGLSEWSLARARHHEATQALGSASGADAERWLHAQADAAAAVDRLGGWEREHQAEAMLMRLGVLDPSQRVSTMSGGERRRVDLARLLVARPDVAILDEPTNHLDVETIEWLEGHLRDEQPGALLVITHDRVFLDRMVHRTAELADGTLRVYEGGYEAYLEARLEREAHEARAEQNRQNLMRRELEWLRRGPAARTTKQKARIQRAEAIIGQRGPQAARDVALNVDTVRSGKTVLVLDELRLDVGGRTLVDGLTMALTPGERIGIVGPNGAGKTTLLRAVLGELAPTSGRVVVGQNARVTYLGQTREGLEEDATVFENVAGGRMRVEVGEATMDTRGYLERFLFDGHQQRQKVSSLSGGERARVLLAKLLLVPTNLLILDEPTNDLDLPTLSALEQMLVELKGTALVVTHDRWFLDRVATGILAFERDGEVVRYPGGYSMYRALKKEQESLAQTPSERPAPRASEPAPKSETKSESKGAPKNKKSLTYGERIELEGILDRIAEAEARVAGLERALADPALYQGGGDASGLVRQLDEARESVTTLMARWEHLEAKSAG